MKVDRMMKNGKVPEPSYGYTEMILGSGGVITDREEIMKVDRMMKNGKVPEPS